MTTRPDADLLEHIRADKNQHLLELLHGPSPEPSTATAPANDNTEAIHDDDEAA